MKADKYLFLICLLSGLFIEVNTRRLKAGNNSHNNSLYGTYVSKFIRLTKGQDYKIDSVCTNWIDTAWRNDRIHKQIFLWSKQPLRNISYEVSDLVNEQNRIVAGNIRLRFGTYVLGDAQAASCDKAVRTNTFIADALSVVPVTYSEPGDPIKIWVTIDVPLNTPAGCYKGRIVIKVHNMVQQIFTTKILVVNKILPAASNWSFHLDLWQFPFQLVTLYNELHKKKIKPFSERYFNLIHPFYTTLADIGQTSITTYIKDGAFVSGQTMIRWIKLRTGQWNYDFTNFDLYVSRMMKWGIKKQINCFSLTGWQKESIGYFDQKTATSKTLQATIGSSDYISVWSDFLNAFKTHLENLHWFDKAVLFMDEVPEEQIAVVIKLIRKSSFDWKIGLAGWKVSKETEDNLYDYSTIFGDERVTSFDSSRVATFYTSCTQLLPNNYVTTQTQPAEMTWMSWYAAKAGFTGYLRWAYDFWTKTDPADIRDGPHSAGDYNMIYRTNNSATAQPVSSIRLELLREGIQDFEKLRVLRNSLTNEEVQKFTIASADGATALVNEAQSLLKKVAANY